jgi:CHAT domain-containing protein/predicted negative regulator of RcsB-dependent stress response
MTIVSPPRCWRGIVFVLLIIALLGAAQAQTAAKDLADLRATASDLYKSGEFAEALRLYERATPLVLRDFGADHEQMAIHYHSLGLVAEAAGNLAAAERYYRAAIPLREKLYGADSAGTAVALDQLASLYLKMGRPDAADPLVQRAAKIRQDIGALLGPDHAFFAGDHANRGDLNLARGDWAAAISSYREAIRLLTGQATSQTLAQAIVQEEVRRQRETFIGLCRAAWQMRSAPDANAPALFEETFVAAQTAWATSAASALAKMSARLGAGSTPLGQRIRRVQDLSDRVLRLNGEDNALLAHWSAVQRQDARYSAVAEEFRAASLARGKATAPTVKRQTELVQQLTALMQRCPPGQKKVDCEGSAAEIKALGQELAELAKTSASGADEIMAIHRRLEAADKALPGYAAFNARRTTLRGELDGAEDEVRRVRGDIVKSFPQYVALTDPKPLTAADVRALLGDDEALVALLVGSSRSFVWALTRERMAWAEIEAGSKELGEHVAALRRGLDPLAQQDAEGSATSRAGVVPGFDLERAHRLYRLVLGPVAEVLNSKRHLIIVPTGPLTSLPLQVLVKDAPTPPGASQDTFRRAAWLIRSHALSVLPSVQSLSALRRLAPTGTAKKPFFGVGDPILRGPLEPQQRGQRKLGEPSRFYRNGLADTRAVRELPPLPDTADEVRTIAKVLGASAEAINLREAASESRVKSAALREYHVIHFATHGLVAGDLSGLSEPALVLTPPERPSETDDGLLTASEIAALELDADWVVLSACNTAAGAGEGAEALSGLARAFFYAGARALLVSHWSVFSTAATQLTIKTFAALASDPRLGRAEAFRRSMLALIDEGQGPSYWAPFVIVGEGAALR